MSASEPKVVIVSGAAGALGHAVVTEFLSRGATVIGVDREERPGVFPDSVSWYQADLANEEAARAVIDQAVQEAGRVDVLAHLVGGFRGGQPIWNTPMSEWIEMLQLNLLPAVHVVRHVLPHMLPRGYGRLVLVGSRAGDLPTSGLTAYSVSKAALHMLVRCVATELRNTGITINAVLPSIIDTPANRRAMPEADFSRWVTTAELARVIAWLASDEATSINGALIPVYGQV